MCRACWRSVGVLALAVAVAGCGVASRATTATPATTTPAGAPRQPAGGSASPPAGLPKGSAGAAGAPAAAGAIAVIRNWSSQLAAGHVAAASAYFATPSVIQVDPNTPAVTLRTQADVRAANQAFPCGARLLSTRTVSGYVDSLFLLANRPGGGPGGCGSGTGLTARVAFVIKAGRIVQWLRIPSEPGDSAHDSPGAAPPSSQQPSAPSPGSQVSAI